MDACYRWQRPKIYTRIENYVCLLFVCVCFFVVCGHKERYKTAEAALSILELIAVYRKNFCVRDREFVIRSVMVLAYNVFADKHMYIRVNKLFGFYCLNINVQSLKHLGFKLNKNNNTSGILCYAKCTPQRFTAIQ